MTKGNKEGKKENPALRLPSILGLPYLILFFPTPLSMQPCCSSPINKLTNTKRHVSSLLQLLQITPSKGESSSLCGTDNKSTRYTCHAHNQKHPHLACLRVLTNQQQNVVVVASQLNSGVMSIWLIFVVGRRMNDWSTLPGWDVSQKSHLKYISLAPE